MPAAGDLKTVLSLEDFEYISGLRDAAAETEKFAGTVTQMGTRVKAAAGTLKDTVRGGLQDFAKQGEVADVAQGALQGLSGTITGVVSKMGPWGFVIGTAAGILGDQLIPTLFEGSKAAKEFGEAMAESASAFEKLEGKWKSSDAFERHLGRAAKESSPDAIESEKRGLEDDADDLKKSIDRREKELRRQVEAARDAGGVVVIGRGAGMTDAQIKNAQIDPDAVGMETFKSLKEQQDKLNEEREELARKQRRAGALEGILPDARRPQGQRDREKEDADQAKKDQGDLDRLQEKTRTPQERLAERLNDLATLGLRNPGSDDLINRGMEDALKEFQAGLPAEHGGGERLASAAEQGSAAAFSTINRAMAQSQRGEIPNQQLAEAKRQVEIAKDQLEQLKKLQDKNNVVPVQLAGG